MVFSLASARVKHSYAPELACRAWRLCRSPGLLVSDSGSVALLLVLGTDPWAEGRQSAGCTAGRRAKWQTAGRLHLSGEMGQGEKCGAPSAVVGEDTGADSGKQSTGQRR